MCLGVHQFWTSVKAWSRVSDQAVSWIHAAEMSEARLGAPKAGLGSQSEAVATQQS